MFPDLAVCSPRFHASVCQIQFKFANWYMSYISFSILSFPARQTMMAEKVQIILHWNWSPAPPLSFLLRKVCRNSIFFINCLTVSPLYLATSFFYHLIQGFFPYAEVFAQSQISIQPVLSWVPMLGLQRKTHTNQRWDQSSFHKVFSPVFGCDLSHSVPQNQPGWFFSFCWARPVLSDLIPSLVTSDSFAFGGFPEGEKGWRQGVCLQHVESNTAVWL